MLEYDLEGNNIKCEKFSSNRSINFYSSNTKYSSNTTKFRIDLFTYVYYCNQKRNLGKYLHRFNV